MTRFNAETRRRGEGPGFQEHLPDAQQRQIQEDCRRNLALNDDEGTAAGRLTTITVLLWLRYGERHAKGHPRRFARPVEKRGQCKFQEPHTGGYGARLVLLRLRSGTMNLVVLKMDS
jgi:hypothetical protein